MYKRQVLIQTDNIARHDRFRPGGSQGRPRPQKARGEITQAEQFLAVLVVVVAVMAVMVLVPAVGLCPAVLYLL